MKNSIFEIIDQPEKSYWIGFLQADGNLLKEKTGCKRISLALSTKDVLHLEKYASFLGKSDRIKTRVRKRNGVLHSVSEVRFANASMFDSLSLRGLIPNKTETDSFFDVELINIELRKFFWLGYFDGNGGIYPEGMLITFSNSSYKVFLSFLDSLHLRGFESIQIKQNKTKLGFTVRVRLPLQISNLLLDYLYHGSPIFLERKKEKNTILRSVKNLYSWEKIDGTVNLIKTKSYTNKGMLIPLTLFYLKQLKQKL